LSLYGASKHVRGGIKYPYGAVYGSNGDSTLFHVYRLKVSAEL